jgi:NAD(P)-dependent dehydrogenase (short-subunit alcohol dehydrogenase family)
MHDGAGTGRAHGAGHGWRIGDRPCGGAAAGAVADAARAAGGQARALTLDVADDAALTAAIGGVARDAGRLDVLFSHAGLQVAGGLEQATAEDMDASWRLNVRAHFVAARAAMAVMRPAGRGSIIITASNSGVQHDRDMIAYCTTKHAAVAMVRQIAVDFARHGVRCNALCPGFVDTPFNAGFEAQMGGRAALSAYVRDRIPMARWGSADEMAEAVLYLASDASAFMTGHALVIDGAESL